MSDPPGRTTLLPPGQPRPGAADEALVERLLADQRQHWQRGEPLPVETVLEQHPALRDNGEAVLLLIFNEVVLREQRGEMPRPEEYQGRFPRLAEQLQLQFTLDRALRSHLHPQLTLPLPTQPGSSGQPPAGPVELPSVPGYELVAELGRGGMGVVYQAWQNSLRRLVALKMIPAHVRIGPEELARFRAEAEAVARLRHPNIVQIYEIGAHDGRPYLALEYCDGGSLADRLGGKPLPPRDAAALAAALARAVHYAHRKGVIHRDLKPANVLLQRIEDRGQRTEDTDSPRPSVLCPLSSVALKITDFGLAKAIGVRADQTASGTIQGTPSYMAPEQAAGLPKTVGPAADTYALGAILYECLTGRPPFLAASPVETVLQVREREPVSVRRLNAQVPRDLETVCHKCLQKEPAKRYASALELADDLARYLDHRPIRARPVGPLARSARWCRRNPALAATCALAAASLLAAAGLSVAFGVAQYRAAQAIRAEQRQTERLTASLAADRGTSLCEQGLVAEGLLWFGRSLEIADRADDDGLRGAATANLAHWGDRLHALRACLSHPGPVLAVAVSPNGRTVVTGCADGLARFWDAATGRTAGEPLRHRGPVHAAAWTADGSKVLTGSADGTAQLWEAARRQPAGPALPHPTAVLAAAVAPDGVTVVTGTAGGLVQVWDVTTGERREPPWRHSGEVRAVAFFPGGGTVLSAGADKTARVWRIGAGESAVSVLPHEGAVSGAAVSPDGGRILTGSDSWDVLVWDVASGQHRKLKPNRGRVKAVAFDAAGARVLAGCADAGTAYLLDAASGDVLGTPLPHRGPVAAVAFTPDGRGAVTGSVDGTARLWELATGPAKPLTLPHGSPVRVVAFRPDGRAAVIGGDDTARVWDTATGAPAGRGLPHGAPVRAAAFRPNGRAFLTVAADGRVRDWDPAEGRVTAEVQLELPGGEILGRGGSFSPDGRLLVAPCGAGEARLWDTATGKQVSPPLAHEGLTGAAFSPDGRAVLTGSEDGTARLWDVATGRVVGVLRGHQGHVLTAAFSPDGRTVLTGGKDDTARLWDLATGQPMGAPLPHPEEVWGVAFSLDGRLAVTCCHDGSARLWWVASGKPVGPPRPHGNALLTAAFRPDGRALLTGCWDGTASLWPLPTLSASGVEQAWLWVETTAGMALDAGGAVQLLDAAGWQERRRRLEELGGLPRPGFGPAADPR